MTLAADTARHRLSAGVGAVVGVVLLAACSSSSPSPVADVPAPPAADVPAARVPAAPATTAPPASPERASHPDPTAPVRVRSDAVPLDAKVVATGLDAAGALVVPPAGLAGWYELGPAPGATGAGSVPAVIAGHVDSRAHGRDVFWHLADLAPGDRIEITDAAGELHAFTVEQVQHYPKEATPAAVWQRDLSDLVLITCGGTFDRAARSYRDNVVVFASATA